MPRVPWKEDEIEFVRRKLFDDKEHPVLWLDDLNASFGNDRTDDSIRACIKRKWGKSVAMLVDYPVDTTNRQGIANESSRTNEQWVLILGQNRALIAENKKLHGFQETIIETVEASIAKLPPMKPPTIIIKERHGEEIANLEFGDVQLGSLVRKSDTAGLCSYNQDEMKRRIGELVKAVYEVVEIQRNGGIPIKKCVVDLLGDIVHGETVFKGQGFHIDTLLIDQIFELGDWLVWNFWMPIAELFEKVEVFAVPGNHGRPGMKGMNHRSANFDYILYRHWKTRLENSKHINFYVSASPFMLYELYPGQVHAIIHGEQARSWLGYPYYGIDRLHKQLVSLTGIYIAYFKHGHHHQPHTDDMHVGRKIGNGSIEGGSAYSVGDLMLANVPKQYFFGLNQKRITWEYWLELADKPELKPNERGIYTPLMFEESQKG